MTAAQAMPHGRVVSPREEQAAPLDSARPTASCAQDAYWLSHLLVPGSAAGHHYRAFQVSGPLDLGALGEAWGMVLARHEVLRLTLSTADGRPVARIASQIEHAVTVADFTTAAAAQAWCVQQAAMPFDITEGPLTRLTVARLAHDQHLVMMVAHRAVADERSLSLVIEELSARYAGRPFADATACHSDYARQQRSYLETEDYHRALRWWAESVTDVAPGLSLPHDHARSPHPIHTGDVVRFVWHDSFGRSLRRVCRAHHVAPFVVLLAGYHALLARYSGQEVVPVGVLADTRPRPGFGRVIGPFANLLVLRAEVGPGTTFRELISGLAQTARGAFDRAMVPFEHVVRTQAADRDPRRIPWGDAMFVMSGAGDAELCLPGCQARRVPLHNGSARTDLALTIDRVEPDVAGSLEFRGELFEPQTAAMMVEHLRVLLGAALDDPDLPVSTLPLERPSTQREAVRAADRIAGTAPAAPVHSAIERQASRDPQALAICSERGDVSYHELVDRSTSILAHLGDVKGQPVVVRMAPGTGQLAASLAVLRGGGYLLWFGAGDMGERGRAILAELRPPVMLAEGAHAHDEVAAWYAKSGTTIDVSTLEPRSATAGRVSETLGRGASPREERAAPLGAARPMDALAYTAYTSGSTGMPKGIVQTHEAFAQFTAWMAQDFGLGPGSRVAQWTAPEHDPSLCEIFATLCAGGTLCPVPQRIRAHPEKLVAWLAEQRITFFQTVPSLAREMLKVLGGHQLADLDRLVLMGEALAADLARGLREALPHTRLANIYGPTETIAATWHEIGDPIGGTIPIGRPIPGRQVLVLDDNDRPCPAGVTGQIVIRSPYVASGYIGQAGDPGAFAPVRRVLDEITADQRWYRTGDLGRRRRDGMLEFRGRKDLQVKLAGTRIELADVEATLSEHESVVECAVVPVTAADGLVTRLVAFVVGRDGARAEAWRAHLRERFGAWLQLISFVPVAERLPRNIAGKVDRKRLPDPARAARDTEWSPRTDVERAVAEVWRELFGVKRIGALDTFYSVGGHSMQVPRLALLIEERLGVRIPIADCFAHPTPGGLSRLAELLTTQRRSESIDVA